MNCFSAMRKILLATTLLSMAMSENILVSVISSNPSRNDAISLSKLNDKTSTGCRNFILSYVALFHLEMEKHAKPTMWVREAERQFWNKRPKPMSQDNTPPELLDVLNYDDDRKFPRISDTRFVNEPVQLSPVAMIRRPDLARFSQVDLPSDKSKLDNVKPTVLISIGIQDKNGGSQECSSRKNYRKHNQGWQVQKPFYVDEPQWVEIDADYTDRSVRHPESGDPYIMSRGKKFRIKDPENLEKTIEDYEEFLDYMSKSEKRSAKNRVRRSVETTAGEFQSDALDEKRDQEKETSRYLFRDLDRRHTNKIRTEDQDEESPRIDDEDAEKRKENTLMSPVVFVHRFETDKPRNSVKAPPQGYRFAKRNRTAANDTSISSPIGEKWKIQRENVPSYVEEGGDDETMKIGERFHSSKDRFAIGANKGYERVLGNGVFVRVQGKRGNRHIGEVNYEDNVDRKKAALFERTRDDPYFDKLHNFKVHGDLFIPSRGKKPFDGGLKDSDKKDTRLNGRRWEDSSNIERYAHRNEPENDEREAKNDASGPGSDQGNLATWPIEARLTSKSNSKSSFRTKNRSNYRKKRNIFETRPEFQNDALLRSIKIAEESAEAYLTPRDKHGNILDLQNHLFTDPFFIMRGKKAPGESAVNSMTEQQNQDDFDRATHYSINEDLLELLMERAKCNDDYCDPNQWLKSTPVLRDRRDPALDKLLMRKYDPFVINRGKRLKPGNF
ncbi:PREDICTED: uncharacterized protein LOC106747424 [Dinoponera quadriceps]|uniref:Uncharacterized protein LOC106747424 n=1 Tax=Dinoponera quadriceps TaxID=609295 RepID=A0A6P3XQB4_DINQU|nr:PREDICTED: uncharacterized protein LOC106747424 [Dinoponera quadriceps]